MTGVPIPPEVVAAIDHTWAHGNVSAVVNEWCRISDDARFAMVVFDLADESTGQIAQVFFDTVTQVLTATKKATAILVQYQAAETPEAHRYLYALALLDVVERFVLEHTPDEEKANAALMKTFVDVPIVIVANGSFTITTFKVERRADSPKTNAPGGVA